MNESKKLTLKKSGWMIRIAYPWRDPPEKISLCRFGWKFLAGLIFKGPITLIACGILIIVLSVGGFLFGKRISFKDEFELMVPIKWLPSIGGLRVLPFWVLVVGFLAYLFWPRSLDTNIVIGRWVVVAILALALSAILIGICGVIVWGLLKLVKKIAQHEFWSIAKAFIIAKKQKICPIIEVVDTESGQT